MKNRFVNWLRTQDNQPLTIHSYIRSRKLKIYKNLILLSLSQSLIFVMYKGLMTLGGYEHDFLGMWSYTSFNFAKIFGFLLLPKMFLSRLKLQKTIRYGLFVFSLFVLIHYVNMIETVIPTALLMGIIASITWASTQFFIYRLTRIMSKISGDDVQTIALRFSGIFFSIYRFYEIVCYIPVSFVSRTHEVSNRSKEHCGRGFHYSNYNSLSEFTLSPRNESFFVASVTIMVLAFCGILLSILFIDPLHKLTSTNLGFEDYKVDFSRTIRLFKRRRLQIMIPMAIFAGFEKPMKSYDFTTAFVGCSESIQHSVFVYFLGCLVSSQMSMSLAFFVEITGLQIILGIAAIIHIILVSTLILQDSTSLMSYYVLSAMWGLASSIWDCLLYVLYGMLSPNDELEAYCHLGLWYSIGALMNFIMTKFVSVSLKLWMAFVCLIFAIFGILLLPFVVGYTSKKVAPAGTENSTQSTNPDHSRNLGMEDSTRRANRPFRNMRHKKIYNRADVKSISTSRIHYVAIPKTRTRFDRHESSNEDEM